MSRTDRNHDHGDQDDTQEHRGQLVPRSRPHHDPSSVAASVAPYYDPEWIAVQLPAFKTQIVGSLMRQGHPEDRAVEAFQEAVVVLFETQPDRRTRRKVHHFLRQVAFQVANKARGRTSCVLMTPEPPDRPADVALDVEFERRAHLRAAINGVRSLRSPYREVLVKAVHSALDQELGPDPQTGTLELSADQSDEARLTAAQLRMRRIRARQQLRTRLRDWLVGVPIFRLACRRGDLSVGGRCLGLGVGAAAVVATVATMTVLPPSDADHPTHVMTQPSTGPAASTSSSPTVPSASARNPSVLESGARVVNRANSEDGPPPRSGIEHPPDTPLPLPHYPSTEIGGSKRDPGDASLVCNKHVPLVPNSCIAHPLRQTPPGESPLN